MPADDLCYTPATQLVHDIRTANLSPIEIVDAVLRRIETIDPIIHAFVTVAADSALQAAQEAEAAVVNKVDLGPLHGIPVSIKDLNPTAGLRTTYGSKWFEHHVPDEDDIVVERIKRAGGIIIGKTNAPQFGYKDMSDNLIGPATHNPWKLDCTPGGSSGGAAAAVAAGFGPIAHGSDGGGSIRIPASLCGVFGLKPSFGRIPVYPNSDIFSTSRVHNGPISRTVADAALFLGVMAGPDARDPFSIDATFDAAFAHSPSDLYGLRVAWSPNLGYARVAREVQTIVEGAVQKFTDLGCVVEEVNPGWDDPVHFQRTLWFASEAMHYAHLADEHPDWIEPDLMAMIRAGQNVSLEEIGKALMERTVFFNQVRSFFDRYDLLLTPTISLPAWSVDAAPQAIDGCETLDMFDHIPFTFPFNLTGHPAASVPAGWTIEGLPVGLQIVGRWHADDTVLRAAAAYEAIAPWSDRRPPVTA